MYVIAPESVSTVAMPCMGAAIILSDAVFKLLSTSKSLLRTGTVTVVLMGLSTTLFPATGASFTAVIVIVTEAMEHAIGIPLSHTS